MKLHGPASVRVCQIGGPTIQNRYCAVSILDIWNIHFAKGLLEAILGPVALTLKTSAVNDCVNFSTQEISLEKNLIPKYSWRFLQKELGYGVRLLKKIHFKFSISLPLNFSPSHQHPSGYGTYPSATYQAAGHHCATSSLPRSAPGTLGWPRSSAANATSSSSSSSSSLQQIQQRISIPPNSSQGNQKCNLTPG